MTYLNVVYVVNNQFGLNWNYILFSIGELISGRNSGRWNSIVMIVYFWIARTKDRGNYRACDGIYAGYGEQMLCVMNEMVDLSLKALLSSFLRVFSNS